MTVTPPWRTVGVFSRGIAAIPHLAALLGAEKVTLRPVRPRDIDAVVGWGEKRNTQIARAWARFAGVPYWRAEDGFVRSVGLGVTGDPPLSIVLDDLGVYYDARRPSRLEQLLATESELNDPALLARATSAIARKMINVEIGSSAGSAASPKKPPAAPQTPPAKRCHISAERGAGVRTLGLSRDATAKLRPSLSVLCVALAMTLCTVGGRLTSPRSIG